MRSVMTRIRRAQQFQRRLALLAAAGAIGAIHGCSGGRGAAITVKGSDTMVILGQRWAEAYMAGHKGVLIQVTGGGSGTGFAALINGTTDICQASRPIKEEERQQMQTRFGAPPREIVVARDGLAIYLHEANPVKQLTLAQLKAIYTGQATRWSQVGGPDAPIVLYGRENSSGTYEYFKEHVLEKADYVATMQTLPGTAAVVNAVALDPNGAWAESRLGWLDVYADRSDEAKAHFEKAMRLSPLDPLTYFAVPLVLLAAVVTASYLPARRASR